MKQITLRLDDDTFAALATEAEMEDRSINWVIRRAIEQAAHPWILSVPNDPAPPLTAEKLADLHRVARDGIPVLCPHPKARIVKGQCQACSEYVG